MKSEVNYTIRGGREPSLAEMLDRKKKAMMMCMMPAKIATQPRMMETKINELPTPQESVPRLTIIKSRKVTIDGVQNKIKSASSIRMKERYPLEVQSFPSFRYLDEDCNLKKTKNTRVSRAALDK